MRVLLAMSGGVDSCVSAHLLKEAGHEVVGITLVFHPDVETARCNLKICCSRQDTRDAEEVCGKLGIPHHTLDLSKEFDRTIVQPFIDSYRLGKTPNPCGRCNRFLKIGRLAELLKEYGCEKLATGHYCRVVEGELYRGKDAAKDQSYFLSMVRSEHIQRMLFPLGEMAKPEVRNIANRLNLVVADKRESQELCFTGGKSPNAFVSGKISEKPGFIKHVSGHIFKLHHGMSAFNIGQRKGLGIAWHEPLYVLELDARSRTVIVGERHFLEKRTVLVRNFNRLSKLSGEISACIRYNQEPKPVETVSTVNDTTLLVRFRNPVAAVAPGQILAAYAEDRVIGGGIIAEAM